MGVANNTSAVRAATSVRINSVYRLFAFWGARRIALAYAGPIIRRRNSSGSASFIAIAKFKKGDPTLPSRFPGLGFLRPSS